MNGPGRQPLELFSPDWVETFNREMADFAPTADSLFPHIVNFRFPDGRSGFLSLAGLVPEVAAETTRLATLDFACPPEFLLNLIATGGDIAAAVEAACRVGALVVEQTEVDVWYQSVTGLPGQQAYYGRVASFTLGCGGDDL